MRRMQTIALGAAVFAGLTVPANADDTPSPQSSPVGQYIPYRGNPTPQAPMPGSSGQQGGAGMPGAPVPLNPDGSPMMPGGADGAGSGAFDPGAGGGAGGGGAGADGSGGGGGGANPGGFASGLGGVGGSSGAPPGVIGDFQPISQARVVTKAATRFPNIPTPIPPPRVPNGNPGTITPNGTTSVLYKLTGLKISDNQSPIPQDRFFYSFNYFDNLNASVNRRLNNQISNLQVYHQLFGLEKTLFDGRASIGVRVPLNTISLNSKADIRGLPRDSTAPGDLSIFAKLILLQQGSTTITGGLQVTVPTGPGAFGGNKFYSYFRDTQIQPFVGFLFRRDRFYAQGFSSINVPTTSRDVTLLFNDVSIGYYVYRPTDPDKFVTAIVPTAEAHLTTPLNHRGFNADDLASTPDFLNMTFGTSIELKHRAIISAAYVTPVTGPKPFNAEFVLLLNVRFGGRNNSTSVVPPIAQ